MTMELQQKLYEEIEALSEAGNNLFDQEHYGLAIEKWQQALDLVPEPRSDWDATLWLCASIGDAHYQNGQFALAREFLLDAMNAPGGTSNPFVLFRMGQAEARLGNSTTANEYLLRAYMLDGTDIFDADPEGAAYLKMLRAGGSLP